MTEIWSPIDPADPVLVDGLARLTADRLAALDAGARHTGWKVGFNGMAMRPVLGINSAIAGYLTDATAARNGQIAVPETGAALEVEVAFVMGAAISPEAGDDEALAAIESIALAFEVVVIGDFTIDHALAHDVWHHGYAVGEPHPWSADALGAPITLTHGDDTIEADPPAAGPLADVAAMLRFTAGGVAAIGGSLDAGDVILSGSLAPSLLQLTPGDRVSATSASLGRLELELIAG